eukprot:933531_1
MQHLNVHRPAFSDTASTKSTHTIKMDHWYRKYNHQSDYVTHMTHSKITSPHQSDESKEKAIIKRNVEEHVMTQWEDKPKNAKQKQLLCVIVLASIHCLIIISFYAFYRLELRLNETLHRKPYQV